MTGSKVNDYSIGDSDIEKLMLSTDKLFKGFHKVSLTNYDNTSAPQIAAGSVVECGGALYKFDSNETITGSPSDGTVYIMIVPGLTTCTAQYTNTAPTWNDANQGWYGISTTAGYRYLEFKVTKASSTWSNKRLFSKFKNIDSIEYNNVPVYGFMSDGTALFSKLLNFNYSSTNTLSVAHGITNAYSDHKIISVLSIKLDDSIVDRYADETDVTIIAWDDTNITMTLTGIQTKNYTLFVIYK